MNDKKTRTTVTLTYGGCLTSSATARRGCCSGGLVLALTWIVDIASLFRGLTSVLWLWLIPCCYTARNCGWVDTGFLGIQVEATIESELQAPGIANAL